MPSPSRLITITGKLPEIPKEAANRVAVYLFSGSDLLSESTVPSGGNVRFHVTPDVLERTAGLRAVVGPAGLGGHALARADLPSIAIDPKQLDKGKATLEIALGKLSLNQEILARWWRWCHRYCVHGTVVGPDGCPVPGAQVTVYSVAHQGWFGYSKTPRVTVTADAAGAFQACFNWCTCRFCRPCWPCWPVWWFCWPWWWELDILHILERIETTATLNPRGLGSAATFADSRQAPLSQPAVKDLMLGRGFTAAHKQEFVPDENRKRLIERKLANPAIRALFPWWWWCCDDPNIVFSVAQNGNVILDEDPATSTRWCFEDGSSVTLVGDASTITACDPHQPPPEGFAWIQVGNILVSDISQGYADGTPGTDASDMAFAGNLRLHGSFSVTQGIAFYQILVGQWTGTQNTRRAGGVPPAAFALFGGPLTKNVSIFRAATLTVDLLPVMMGPCIFAGNHNLYATEAQRPNVPGGVVGLDPFPVLNAGDFIIGWSDVDVKVNAAAAALIPGSSVGGVDLTTAAYDVAGNPVAMVTNLPLTLMIDTTGISGHIDSLKAYDQTNNEVLLTGGSDEACPAYDIGSKGYVLLHVTVTDPNLHLYGYEIETEFGQGSTSVPTVPAFRGYSQAPGTFTPAVLPATPGIDGGYLIPNAANVAFGGGGDYIKISPTVNCCYDFRLNAGKRVTDGESPFNWGNCGFQTATIKAT